MRRRTFLKGLGLGAATAMVPRGLWAGTPAAAEGPPNVVLIFTDGQGGCDEWLCEM